MFFRFMSFRLLLILLLSVLSTLAPTGTVLAATPTILVYGDSLSAAYGIPREQGWVTLLQRRLQNQGFPHQVVNASISGETTSGGLSRMQSTLNQYQPEIVLIELGANDGLRGLPISDMQHNLTAMIEASQAVKARVVLLGMMIPPNYGQQYTKAFAESYPKLAQRYRLPLVTFFLDGVAGNPALVLDDGLHPSVTAQPQILDNVWKVLQPELVNKTALPTKK